MNSYKGILNIVHMIWISAFITLAISSAAFATIPTGDSVRVQIQNEVSLSESSHLSEQKRTKIVRNFVKKLKKLSDNGLGNPEFLHEKSEVEIQAMSDEFKQNLIDLVAEYKSHVKPILLENIKFKRKDDAAKFNRGELIQLSFPSRFNYKTGQPVIGLLHYKKDVSSSLFGSKTIDAGILSTFPSWEDEPWLQNALQMDMELAVLRQMHRAYQDGTEFKTEAEKHKQSVIVVKEHSAIAIAAKPALSNKVMDSDKTKEQKPDVVAPEELSVDERSAKVSRFARSLRKLKVGQDIEGFKQKLLILVNQYEQEIKPILVDNVNQHRSDTAARTNKGDLLSLFFPSQKNHQTGKPITGKLRYKKDVSTSFFSSQIEEVGLLVDHPELKDDKVIQAALIMEKELEILKQEHRDYLESESMTFVH